MSNKIVLIEDDKSILEMYELKFKEEGLDVLIASDGLSGLELIKTQQPNLILLDIMLPKMDGFAILTEIKKDDKLKNIPVLLLTNLGQKADIEKGEKLGAVDYVVKASLTPAQVVEKIQSYLK